MNGTELKVDPRDRDGEAVARAIAVRRECEHKKLGVPQFFSLLALLREAATSR